MEEAKQMKVEISKATTAEEEEVEKEEAKGKGYLMDDQIMEVKEVREPKSPSRLTSASNSGLHRRLGFKEKTRRGAIKSAIEPAMKARSKAKKSGIGVSGGQDKSQLEVIGDGVDVVHLTASLRKNAKLISVGPVMEQTKEAKEDEPMLQPLVSPSAPHHIYPINESLVDSVETEKLNGAMNMEMKTKASINSNLGSENAGSSCTSKTTEWTLLITSLLLEGIS